MKSETSVETAVQSPGKAYARAERLIALVLPSLGDELFIGVLLAVTLGLQGRALGIDGDSAWSIRIGQQILTHGLPRSEFLLSTSMGQPVVYWEWLSQVAYALGYRLGGLNGVVALAGLIVAATSLGLYLLMRRSGTPLLLALALALIGTSLTSITWTARAQLFSLPLTLWWTHALWVIWRTREPRRLWRFPLVMALWANLHGGFIGGLIIMGVAVAVAWLMPPARDYRLARSLSLTLAASALATLLTPWGPALPLYVLRYLRNPLVTRYTQEYQSPDFHQFSGLLFLALVALVVATWLRLVARGQRLDPLFVALASVWTVMACVSIRFVPLWVLVVLPMLSEFLPAAWAAQAGQAPDHSSAPLARLGGSARLLLQRVSRVSRRIEVTDARVGKGIWPVLVTAFIVATLLNGGVVPFSRAHALHATYDASALPVEAAQRLAARGLPAGRGFNTFAWGGYLDLAVPAYHPFIDSRSDAYSERLLNDYVTITSLLPGWEHVLDRYNVRWALLPTRAPLTGALASTPRWHCAPADSHHVAMLCTRTVP